MKKKNYSITFIVIVVLSLFYFNCSTNEDTITFLESHDGTVWSNYSESLLYIFNNDIARPFDVWNKCINENDVDGNYYNYSVLSDFELRENSEKKFSFVVVHGYYGKVTWTFTRVNNSIQVKSNIHFNPFGNSINHDPLYPSNIDVDNLLDCN